MQQCTVQNHIVFHAEHRLLWYDNGKNMVASKTFIIKQQQKHLDLRTQTKKSAILRLNHIFKQALTKHQKFQNHISQNQSSRLMTSLPEAAIASFMGVNGYMTQSFRAVKLKIIFPRLAFQVRDRYNTILL